MRPAEAWSASPEEDFEAVALGVQAQSHRMHVGPTGISKGSSLACSPLTCSRQISHLKVASSSDRMEIAFGACQTGNSGSGGIRWDVSPSLEGFECRIVFPRPLGGDHPFVRTRGRQNFDDTLDSPAQSPTTSCSRIQHPTKNLEKAWSHQSPKIPLATKHGRCRVRSAPCLGTRPRMVRQHW